MLHHFTRLIRLFSQLIPTLEQEFLHLTQPTRHSFVLAAATDLLRSKSQLIAENALLRQQLIILHRQVKKPRFTHSDRLWFVLLASRVQNWKDTLLILKPETLLRWHRQGFRLFWKFQSRNRGGRPRLSVDTISLIQQMAKDNLLWGAERIHGELLKLDIKVATATIQKYMRLARPLHAPSQTWSVFLHNHAKDVWACDFLPVIDLLFRPIYLFFIVELGSRRVVHFNVTSHPTDAWVAQQLREATPYGQQLRFLIRDRDGKYGEAFTAVAKGRRIEILKTPYRTPTANAICERFLGSVRRECLDHMLILGESHLYRVVKEYVALFNQARPHQGINQRIPQGTSSEGQAERKGKIIVSGVIGEELAVAAMKQGADDYLLKDRLARLGPAATHALQAKQLREEKRQAEEQLLYLCTHDMLTGLLNRASFESELARFKVARQFPISGVMAQVHGLTEINDRHGYTTGDKLLRRAARVFQDEFRAEDVVARIGGDAFAAPYPGQTPRWQMS